MLAHEAVAAIAIRLALGAQPHQVRRQFVGDGMALTAAGVAAGLVAAALLTRVMSSLLFGISRLDPLTYTLMTLVLIIVAMAAPTCRHGGRHAMIRRTHCGQDSATLHGMFYSVRKAMSL